MHRPFNILIVILAAGMLATALPAQAIYIDHPLQLRANKGQADVGDEVEFVITPSPDNATAKPAWAGKQVHLRYSYDANEGGHASDPDAPVSNEGYTEGDIQRGITLNGEAGATIHWTIPSHLDTHNVLVFIETPDGERLGTAHLAVGDATPMFYILADHDDGFHGEPELRGPATDTSSEDSNEAPAVGLIGVLALLALAGLGVARSRRD